MTRERTALAGEAAHWFTAMQAGEVSARERTEFCQWLEQSPQNVQEYLSVASLWRHLDATGDARRSAEDLIAAARADSETTNVVTLHGTNSVSQVPAKGREVRRPRVAIAAALTLLALGSVAWLVSNVYFDGERYATAIGEQKSFTLADGSVVRLNTKSAIHVRLDADRRDIQLIAGEAMFEVTGDPRRPFRVHVGGTTVEAVGTVFNVYRAGPETRVTVLEGRVRVSIAEKVTELAPREQARVRAVGSIARESQVNLEQTAAWTSRRLVFYTETLGTVVSEFNRYNPQRLTITDPELAELRISGNFRATDPQSLVQFLQRTEEVSAVAEDDGTLILSRRKPQ